MKIGETTKPRFEFRTFGQSFEDEHYRMSRLSDPVPENFWERYSEDMYIMSRANDINNTKVRDGKIDIKTFVQSKEGLEQWDPLMKAEFPISGEILANKVFPAFQVSMPKFKIEEYTFAEFKKLIDDQPELQVVRVNKYRLGFMVNKTICEVATVLINGAKVMTISTESTEVVDIKKTMKDVGLYEYENINYLQAIKRVIGMIDKPLEEEII